MERNNSRSQTPTGTGRTNHRPNGTNPDGTRSRSKIRPRGRSQQLVPSDNKPLFRVPPPVVVRKNNTMVETRRRQFPPSPRSFRNRSLTPHRQQPPTEAHSVQGGKPNAKSSEIHSGTRSMSSPRTRSTYSLSEGLSREKILGMIKKDVDLHDIFKKIAIEREGRKSSRQRSKPKDR